MAQKKFTLYLIKETIEQIEDIFRENVRARINAGDAIVSQNPAFAEDATVFIFRNPPKRPQWMDEIATQFEVNDQIFDRSSSAVLCFRHAARLFAVTFGHAWLYLDPRAFVPDFGLRVALNAADDSKLKRLDVANLGEALKEVTQSASQRQLETFGVDEALELVRKVTGSIIDETFGSSLSGSNSLKIVKEMDFADIPELAERSLQFFRSTRYRNTPFRIVDNIAPELDAQLIEQLDEEAARSIAGNQRQFELSLPEFSEEDVASFSFVGFRHRRSYADLQVSHYIEMLGPNIHGLSSQQLKTHRVRAEYIDSQKPSRMLNVHNALVGSIEIDGARYAINEGKWYRVDTAFKRSIDRSFSESVEGFDVEPSVIISTYSENGTKRYLQTEAQYNSRYANECGYVLMDQVLIDVPEVARSRFELCDLLDIERKRLIHVKMSGRRSSVLSHFFKQGANSASLVKSVDAVWNNVLERITDDFGEDTADSLRDAIEDETRPWSVEFHIADAPMTDGSFNVPFFSRVTFREEKIRLQSRGFEVCVRFIPKPEVRLDR